MFLITLLNNLVIAKASAITENQAGNIVNIDQNVAYGFPVKTFEVETENIPEDYAPYKYFYSEEEGFVIDPNFVEPEPPTIPLEEQLQAAMNRIADLEEAICELSEVVEEGNQ